MTSSREESLGQLLFMRMPADRWSGTEERLLRAVQPAGVLLTPPLPESAEAISALLHRITGAVREVPFLAIREEGGSEDPLAGIFPALPSPRAVAQKGLRTVARCGDLMGGTLKLLGFNTNFAPLLDLATSLRGETLGQRALSSDAQTVAECGVEFVRSLQRHKILACGKHFPGWGSVPLEKSAGQPTGGKLAVSSKPMADLWREDLLPYRKLLPHLPMVLLSNAAYRAYDFDNPRPASLSPQVVQGLLRVKLDYRGLALAYDLESEEVRGSLSSGEAATQSVNAGCDLLVLDAGPLADTACSALKASLESGTLSLQRIEQTLTRVRAAKKGLSPPSGTVSGRALRQLRKQYESFTQEFSREETKIA